jgi:LPXTG-motif cell wall-anchored protein
LQKTIHCIRRPAAWVLAFFMLLGALAGTAAAASPVDGFQLTEGEEKLGGAYEFSYHSDGTTGGAVYCLDIWKTIDPMAMKGCGRLIDQDVAGADVCAMAYVLYHGYHPGTASIAGFAGSRLQLYELTQCALWTLTAAAEDTMYDLQSMRYCDDHLSIPAQKEACNRLVDRALAFSAGRPTADAPELDRTFVYSAVSDPENAYQRMAEAFPVRGDFSLHKTEAGSGTAMQGVRFRLTRDETGESAEFVTDEEGNYSSASEYISHSADNGLWFGEEDDPSDAWGALPPGTYTLEELPTAGVNDGYELYSGSFRIADGQTRIELSVENHRQPALQTSLRGPGGGKYVFAGADTELTDAVSYIGLDRYIGKELRLHGELYDSESGELLGEGDTVFTPEAGEGETVQTFRVDASGLAGRSVTAVESLYDGATQIAEHRDLADAGQTVYFPSLHTTAAEAETGSHILCGTGLVQLTDEVVCRNLEPGTTYTLTAALMDAGTGEPLCDADGKAVQAVQEITCPGDSTECTVTVPIRFQAASDLPGKTAVVFEELTSEGVCYASETDLAQARQTVRFPNLRSAAWDASDGDRILAKTGMAVIREAVYYENVEPGAALTLETQLADARTGEILSLSDGTQSVKTEIQPDEPSGSAEIFLQAKAESLPDTVVVIDRIYDEKGRCIAVHADAANTEQTLRKERNTPPDTGDGSLFAPVLGCAALAAGIGLLFLVRKKNAGKTSAPDAGKKTCGAVDSGAGKV